MASGDLCVRNAVNVMPAVTEYIDGQSPEGMFRWYAVAKISAEWPNDRLIWRSAEVAYASGLEEILGGLIDAYSRKPGKDEVVRVSAECIGYASYEVLKRVLEASPRRNVRFYDQGWYLELRSRFWGHVVRGLQRMLVLSNMADELLVEDLLAHDIGV